MWKLFVTLLLAIVIIGMGAAYYIDSQSHIFLAQFLSKRLNTKVSIDRASLGWRNLTLEGIAIKNNTAIQFADLLKIERLDIEFEPTSVVKDVVVLPTLAVEKPVLNIEFYSLKGDDNNWAQFFNNLPENETAGTASTATSVSEKSSEKELLINTLIIKGLTVNAAHKLIKDYALKLPPMPTIVLNNFNNAKPLTAYKELQLILRAIVASVAQSQGLDKLVESLRPVPSDLQSTWKSIQSQLPKANAEEANTWQQWWQNVQDGASKGWENIKGFFKGKKPQDSLAEKPLIE